MMSGTPPALATVSTALNTPLMLSPLFRAIWLAAWMTGPSITGSEYGSPISTASTPCSTMVLSASSEMSGFGKPYGRYPMKAGLFSALSRSNMASVALGL